MGRSVGKLAGSRRGMLLRARHLRNLMFALAIVAVSIVGPGLRLNQLLSESRFIDEMLSLIQTVSGRMEQVEMWLEVEDAMPGLPPEAFAPLAARAVIAAQEMEALHERALQIAWSSGRSGDVSAPAAENFDTPLHRIDMMVRSFLRGVARTVEARGSQRVAGRRDMRMLAREGLFVAFASVQANMEAERLSLRHSASVVAMLGAAGAFLGMLMALVFHVRGPRRANASLELRVDESMARVEEVEVFLRGAERDRARMMDLSASGLELPAERMRAAAGLLARTPLSETQGRVLHGLRQALGEIAGRVEGLRVLASQGDGRLRLTLRPMQPGVIYADWLGQARARAKADGKIIVAEAELDKTVAARGDELMIRRALDRMLEDALRRSAKGGRVSIVAQLESTGRRWPELRVVVEHDGPAPGPSEIAAIRAPFSSRPPSEATVNRSVDPFALAVVAAICTATGGGLDISSRLKGGARAVARLRLAPASEFFDEGPQTVGPAAQMDRGEGASARSAPAQGDPEGWAAREGGDALDSHRSQDCTAAQRLDGGRDRRRSRQSVPAPDPDLS